MVEPLVTTLAEYKLVENSEAEAVRSHDDQ